MDDEELRSAGSVGQPDDEAEFQELEESRLSARSADNPLGNSNSNSNENDNDDDVDEGFQEQEDVADTDAQGAQKKTNISKGNLSAGAITADVKTPPSSSTPASTSAAALKESQSRGNLSQKSAAANANANATAQAVAVDTFTSVSDTPYTGGKYFGKNYNQQQPQQPQPQQQQQREQTRTQANTQVANNKDTVHDDDDGDDDNHVEGDADDGDLDQDVADATSALINRAMNNAGLSSAGGDEDGDAGGADSLENDEGNMPDDPEFLSPDDPLMKRVQDALKKQLSTNLGKITLDLKEKEEALRKIKKQREDIGVDLYSVQQQLARIQANLENAHDTFNVIRGIREESERQLAIISNQYQEQNQRFSNQRKSLEQHQSELEKINKVLRQIEIYSDEVKDKIAVTKRATLKAEEDILKKEGEKKKQDYLVDVLTEQIKMLQERRALYEAQFVTQSKETQAARETLQEAAMEMEAINFEKKQLIHQWKSSLIAMQKRDDALQAIEAGIQKKREEIMSMEGEIHGFKHSFRKEQEKNEMQMVLLNKLENEVSFLKRQIQTIQEQKDKLKESFTMYTKSLGHTEQQLNQVNMERASLQQEVNGIQKLTLQTIQDYQKLENEIWEHLQTQTSIEKGSMATQKDRNRIRHGIHEKEAQIADAQNELANVRMDRLNANSRIETLQSSMGQLNKALQEKNELIERYELEIRKRNDELNKKQSEVDQLNKKYDQLTSSSQDESTGPLEATIHNLSKAVGEKEKECADLQQFWLRSQNELVNLSKEAEAQTEKINDLRIRANILTRKKMSLSSQYENIEREIREYERSIRSMQNEMVKVNALISKNTKDHMHLEETNLGLEQEFRSTLKEAEHTSIHMEHEAAQLAEEKQEILKGLIEAERQIMLWEKKIQLAKETQAALDPNVGAAEISEMQAEIHRMKLRLQQMKKLQEKMIQEMEKAVYRRETIGNRAKGRTKSKESTQASIKKTNAELSRRIKQLMGDIKDCDRDISAIREAQTRVVKTVEDARKNLDAFSNRKKNLIVDAEARLQSKNSKRTRRYQELRDNKYTYAVKDPAQRPQEIQRQQEKAERIGDIVQHLSKEYSYLDEHLVPMKIILMNSIGKVGGSQS